MSSTEERTAERMDPRLIYKAAIGMIVASLVRDLEEFEAQARPVLESGEGFELMSALVGISQGVVIQALGSREAALAYFRESAMAIEVDAAAGEFE